jgi:hypothetical protein
MHVAHRSICYSLTLTAGSLLMLACGCGGGSDAVEGPTGTVSGNISYKGAAVPAGCTVTFAPVSGDLPSSGQVDSSGNFSLFLKGGTAIPVGMCNVSVTLPVLDETPQQAMERMQSGGTEEEVPEVPEKYRDAATSGETFEVKKGANTYDLNMKD